MLSFVFLLSLSIILIIYFQIKKFKPSKTLYPPGPSGLPFIGNLHQFDGKFPHKYLHNLSKQYGPIISLKLGFRQVVVISSADLVKEIMKSHDVIFSSRPHLSNLQRLSYNGLDIALSPYSESWREMRKIANIHLFSPKQFQYFRAVYKDEVSKMINKIAWDASLCNTTNLSEMMTSFATNTICRVAFGKSYGEEGCGNNWFFDLVHEIETILGGFFVVDYFPLFGWIDKISGMNAKLERNFRNLDSFNEELINEHLNPNRPKSMEGDIIDLLLGFIRDGSTSFDLTLDHIKALIMNLIIGGSDTVSTILVWALAALMNNPLVMNKVQSEIRKLGEKNDLIDEEDIAKLPYFRAVIKESFRLYPPGPLLVPRETIKKCSINGYEIEPGTMVHINAWAIARDPKTWENPNEFFPERFLESDIDIRGQDPEVIPFGIGRRRCPGVSIGISEVEVALANVLYKFDWELPVGVKNLDFEVLPGLSMHKKNALCLVPRLAIA